MELKLNEHYRVSSDSRQYILQRFTGSYNEEGNEIRTNIGYYGTIEQLVKSLLEREIKTSQVTDLERLIDHLTKFVENMKEIFLNVGLVELLEENLNNFNYIKQLESKIAKLEEQS